MKTKLIKKGIDEYTIRLWTEQRYNYFVAGRTLWNRDYMEMGALMYGYAIEAHVKCAWALFENSASNKALNGHNFKEFFEITARDGFFSDVEIPDSLLEFSRDHFHRRYPQQTYESAKWAKEDGRCLALIM